MRQKPEDGDELGRERERGMMMETSSPARGVGCATNGTRFPSSGTRLKLVSTQFDNIECETRNCLDDKFLPFLQKPRNAQLNNSSPIAIRR